MECEQYASGSKGSSGINASSQEHALTLIKTENDPEKNGTL